MDADDPTALYREGLAHQQAGRVDAALALYDRILARQPHIPEVLFQKARCLAGRDPKAAEAAFRAALKGKPKEPAIWQGLHGLLRGQARAKLEKEALAARIPIGSEAEVQPILAAIAKGNAAQVEDAALRLAKVAPVAFWPVFALGMARQAQSKPAIAPLEAAVARDPSHAKARLALVRACLAAGRPILAEQVLDAGTSASAEATFLRARVLRDTARPDAALALLSKAKSQDARVLAELALTQAQVGQGGGALATARSAARAGVKAAPLLRACAVAAEEAGDIAGAEALIDAALKTPSPDLLTHRAQLHQSAGQFAEADAALRAAIDLDPTHGEAFRAYANGRKLTADDAILPLLEQALARPDIAAPDRAALHFAAAKARGDLGDHGAVMPHLDTANRLMESAFPYGFESDLAEARALVADWQRLEGLPASGPQDPVLFVTGLPRSGTTLIETILSAHPQVGAGGEMPFLGRALAAPLEALRHGEVTGVDMAEAGSRYLSSARRRLGDVPVIADKAIATFSRIGHAARALPGARFLLVRRDPRDVGLSLWRNMFPEGLHRYAYDLTAMGRYIRLHDALVAFWKNVLPGRVYVVDYEALTAEPEPQIRALLDAAGLPFDPACLAPEASGRRIQTLSFAQARRPIGTSAVAGWKRHEAALQPLIAALEADLDLSTSD